MSKVILLERLKEFTEKVTGDLILPVAMQKGDQEPPTPRAAEVYRTRLPDSSAAKKKAPYILHQIITGKDSQTQGLPLAAVATVRSVFCVYHQDEQEGGIALLNLMEQLRIALLQWPVLSKQYQLDLQAGLETLVYPENLSPYYAGEMISVWKMPPVARLDTAPITGGLPLQDPWGNRGKEIITLEGAKQDAETQL